MTFANVREGTSIDIRYCTQNDPGRLALYVNGNKSNDLVFASTGSWDTTYETLTVAVTVSANSTLELRYEAGGSGANIDFLQIK